MAKKIKLISWNVNGLRAVLKKDFQETVKHLAADILLLQETKIQEHQLTTEMTDIKSYQSFWSHSTIKKGYSGVAAYTRQKPVAVKHGIGIPGFDDEGRILQLDFVEFTLFNVYFPNGQMNEERLKYKLDFYRDFFAYTNSLKKNGRSIIITGDYNTAHNEIDLKNPKANENYSGFLRIERDWLDRIVNNGWVDSFRHFYPDREKYSWWSYRMRARDRNVGWRIDYFFVSKDMVKKGWIKGAFIDNDIFGSDHCPIGLVIEI